MTRTQHEFLFGAPLPPVSRATDPETSKAAERQMQRDGRRGGQIADILTRLERGPATNRELAAISLKYTSRISDLRALGYVIECEMAGERGVTVYRLIRKETA